MNSNLRRAIGLLGPVLGLVLVIALFGILKPDQFLTVRNFKTVATQTVIVGLGAIGMTYVIVSAGIDLSIGSVIALSCVVVAYLMKRDAPPLIALLAGIGTGGLCGLLNGTLIATLEIVPFIVTLGMLGVARGVAKYLAENQTINPPPAWLPELMMKTPDPPWLLVSPGIWIVLLLAVFMALVLNRTKFGTAVFAVGSNEATARLCGIRVPRVKLWIYTLCGLFAGLAGVMQFSRLTVGDPTTAVGEELHIIAAVVIGGGSLSGGEGSISGAMIGAFLMSFLSNGSGIMGVPNYVQEIIIGVIIVAAVAMDRLRHRQR